MKIEPNKLGAFQKFWLRLKFPKIPSKDGTMISIKKDEYNLMKNILNREECYINQIRQQNIKIKKLEEMLKQKEKQRRKLASKIGGMQKEMNKLKNGKV